MACPSSLSANIAANCAADLLNGVDSTLYIINYDHVDKDSSTINTDNDNIIESIVLKTASPAYKAYTLIGQKNSNDGYKNEMIKGKFVNSWEQSIVARILDNDPTIKQRIEELSAGKFIIIVKNRYANTTGNSVYEVLGWNQGLIATAIVRDADNADDKGGWMVTFGTDDMNKENGPAKTFFITSLAATEAAIAALIA